MLQLITNQIAYRDSDRKIFLSRRKFLGSLGLGASALCPVVSSQQALVSIPPSFPRPKFHFGQEVEYVLDDFDGSVLVERGVVIGMNYESSDYPRREWSYLLRWAEGGAAGADEGFFIYESQLKSVG